MSTTALHLLPPGSIGVDRPFLIWTIIFKELSDAGSVGAQFVWKTGGAGAGRAWTCQGNDMEHFQRETVASETVASLRGGGRSTPVWWEALMKRARGEAGFPEIRGLDVVRLVA